ncbi:MAG: hypothetical protein M5U01_14660 [Ardenticatenaceae bacterium]|nr:hypothetical protein [Ardenticatenaceae bacterium]
MQRFSIYAERGLARRRVSIWIYEGRLPIAYQHNLLAEYHYRYERRRKRPRAVFGPVLPETEFVSPQLEFWELDDEQWLKVRFCPDHRKLKFPLPEVEQLTLFRFAALLFLLAVSLTTWLPFIR